eukprot:TRINITY_DN1242_c0_g1_i1.p1 TRINITY_DN1242_c0_g1~~TRINITY_DN1242_c0_g1_i1.p1  ORF type:complete len:160 (-),score=19.31 TRINITY_DN1242_c0_g1_i1:209-688(-)
MKIICSLLVLGAAVLFGTALASVEELQTSEKLESSACSLPPHVAYCADVMRVGAQLDHETAEHFANLQEEFVDRAIDDCSWESFDGKMGLDECVSTLSRFVEENPLEVEDEMPELETTDRAFRRKRKCFTRCVRKFCYRRKGRKRCRVRCRRVCRFRKH